MEIASVCTNGSIQPTNHKTIMEQLRIQAERFRKQGRLRDKDLEEIIAEIKANNRTAEEDADKTTSSTTPKKIEGSWKQWKRGYCRFMALPQTQSSIPDLGRELQWL